MAPPQKTDIRVYPCGGTRELCALAHTGLIPYCSDVAIETVEYRHLDCSSPGQPVIADKNFKVVHLIREHVAYGWSAEELALNHPHLTLGEIYSALAYYADHRAEIDREICATEAESGRIHAEPRHTRLAARLKRSTQG